MPTLPDLIATQIRSATRLPFHTFMDLALYHPEGGYYTTKASVLGPTGDFITSPHLGHDFGQLLTVQFADMWQQLGQPQPFHLVEMGAGQGLIAADALAYLQQHHPDCYAALIYTIIEKSPLLRQHQEQRLSAHRVRWSTLEELPPVTGCLFSNELVDAFPVHIVEKHQGSLQEVYVTLGEDNSFQETLGPLSTDQILSYFDLIDIDLLSGAYPEGYRTEVNLDALAWLATVAARLERGYLLTIDYGHTAPRYYSPARRQGTLKCYYQHRHHDDPYANVGQQDLTTHVDFTALERRGAQLGLESRFTQQGLLLMALGLGERVANLTKDLAPGPDGFNQLMERRQALHQLMDMGPMGLGTFGVLIQGKRVKDLDQLRGLMVPG